MKTHTLKIIVALAFIVFYSCSKDDEYLNDYDVQITLNGDVNAFSQSLYLGSSSNDGEGNFISEQLLYKDSGNIAPWSFSTEDLDQTSYSFITARPSENLDVSYSNEILDSTIPSTMTISVLIRRDGSVIDDFTLEYNETTGQERFSVAYNSDNSGFKCYCAENCNLLIPGYCN